MFAYHAAILHWKILHRPDWPRVQYQIHQSLALTPFDLRIDSIAVKIYIRGPQNRTTCHEKEEVTSLKRAIACHNVLPALQRTGTIKHCNIYQHMSYMRFFFENPLSQSLYRCVTFQVGLIFFCRGNGSHAEYGITARQRWFRAVNIRTYILAHPAAPGAPPAPHQPQLQHHQPLHQQHMDSAATTSQHWAKPPASPAALLTLWITFVCRLGLDSALAMC